VVGWEQRWAFLKLAAGSWAMLVLVSVVQEGSVLAMGQWVWEMV